LPEDRAKLIISAKDLCTSGSHPKANLRVAFSLYKNTFNNINELRVKGIHERLRAAVGMPFAFLLNGDERSIGKDRR
jgi:hypothetical protein